MLTFKPVLKDRLFYDQYEYSLNFRLTRVGFLRSRDHKLLSSRIQWHNANAFKWSKSIDETTAQELHDFLDLVNALGPHKLVLTSDYAYIYTNDPAMLENIAQQPYVRKAKASRATINRPSDTVLLSDPKYQYRTYLKERFMDKPVMDTLSKFLLNRSDCFRITDELRRRLSAGNAFYCMNHYFVDHNDMKDLVMLQIVCPGIVRKTLTIQAK